MDIFLVLIPGAFDSPDCTLLAERLRADLHVGPDSRDANQVHRWFHQLAADARQRMTPPDVPHIGAGMVRYHEDSKRTRFVLLGDRQGADLIARQYFQFFGDLEPDAIVLLAPHAPAIHLNNITCPYLTVHGAHEWQRDSFLASRITEAVSHHQYRYGDTTVSRVIEAPDDLGGARLDPGVEDEVVDWVNHALKVGHRPQERMPA